AEQERLKREYHSIRQTSSETSTEFMQGFLRLAGFLGAAADTEEEQAKNFQWGLRRQRSGDRHQPTSQQSSHRVTVIITIVTNLTGEVVVATIAATTTTLATTS
nr:zinc finger, CCHC-type, retrotransposon Gag domain protein [Tanacetum cinerariifolium]